MGGKVDHNLFSSECSLNEKIYHSIKVIIKKMINVLEILTLEKNYLQVQWGFKLVMQFCREVNVTKIFSDALAL